MPAPVRRVVTGHDAQGKAIVLIDGNAPNQKVRQTGIATTLLWVTDETPAEMSGSADRAAREIGVPPPADGSILRVVDFPPESAGGTKVDNATILKEMGLSAGATPARHAHMHRTKSIDYALVLAGEIDMLLDDSEVHLKAGDILVQQGTNHAWVNNGSDVCRIAFVLIDAKEPAGWSRRAD
jgi:quercetin dioxygenase-like cupin family protein